MTLMKAHTRIETTNAERYAIQLCKHFGHKVKADYADRIADIDFNFGKARLVVGDDGLDMTAEAESLETLGRVKYVLDDHLLRFAWREKLAPPAWDGPQTPAPPARPPVHEGRE